MTTGETLATFTGHTREVTSVCVQKGILYSGSDDCTVKRWRIDHSVEQLPLSIDRTPVHVPLTPTTLNSQEHVLEELARAKAAAAQAQERSMELQMRCESLEMDLKQERGMREALERAPVTTKQVLEKALSRMGVRRRHLGLLYGMLVWQKNVEKAQALYELEVFNNEELSI